MIFFRKYKQPLPVPGECWVYTNSLKLANTPPDNPWDETPRTLKLAQVLEVKENYYKETWIKYSFCATIGELSLKHFLYMFQKYNQ